MKAFTSLLITILLSCSIVLSARIVINEVMYDPIGTDTGKEWCELYNSGTESVNLAGAKLQRAGSAFETIYTFPAFVLRPGRYLLIGEASVANAILITNLAFQNGGSETDGIRFVAPDESYTDTLLYDEPNTNLLPDDSGMPGLSFAPDVPAGYSLARICDGHDTDDSFKDFTAEPSPTPGFANNPRFDIALGSVSWSQISYMLQIEAWVINNSLFGFWQDISLDIYLDNVLLVSRQLDEVAPQDSVLITLDLALTDDQNHFLKLELMADADINLLNNVWEGYLHPVENSPPSFSEIMYYPETGDQEWIEIFVNESSLQSAVYTISDLAGNRFSFEIPANKMGFMVLCTNSEALLAKYPECPSQNILQVNGWASLNNDADAIRLFDSQEATVDSMFYTGNSLHRGKSLERNLENPLIWTVSKDASGATPGRQNSSQNSGDFPVFSAKLFLQQSSFKPTNGEEAKLYYQGFDALSRASLTVYDLRGRIVKILADNTPIGESGCFAWNGKTSQGNYAKRGSYILHWESRNQNAVIYKKQLLTAVYD